MIRIIMKQKNEQKQEINNKNAKFVHTKPCFIQNITKYILQTFQLRV